VREKFACFKPSGVEAEHIEAYHDPCLDVEHNVLDARLERFLRNSYGQDRALPVFSAQNPFPPRFGDADLKVAALQVRADAVNRDRFVERDRQAASLVFGKDGTPVTIKDGAWATRLTEAEYRASLRRERELSAEFARIADDLSKAKGAANDLRRLAQDWEMVEQEKRELAEQEAALTPEQRAQRKQYQRDQERTVTDRQALK